MASDNNLDFEKELKKLTPLIKKIASNYLNSRVTMEELIQEGILGVYEAFKKFDPQKEVKLSTYATFWIKKYIIKYVGAEKNNAELNKLLSFEKNDFREVEIGETIFEENKKIILPANTPTQEREVLELLFNDEKTLKEISKILRITREQVRQIKEKGLRRLRNCEEIRFPK